MTTAQHDSITVRAVAQAIWTRLRNPDPWTTVTRVTRRIGATGKQMSHSLWNTARLPKAYSDVEIMHESLDLVTAIYPPAGTTLGRNEWPHLDTVIGVRLPQPTYARIITGASDDARSDWITARDHRVDTIYAPKQNRHGNWKAAPTTDPFVTPHVFSLALALASRAELRAESDTEPAPIAQTDLDRLYVLAFRALSEPSEVKHTRTLVTDAGCTEE